MPGTGIDAYATIFTESTYGTTPGTGGTTVRIVEDNWKRDAQQTRGNRGLGRASVSNIRNKNKKAGGTFKFDAQYEGLERLLLHFFGAVSTSGAGADKTHTFTPSLTRQVGLSIKAGRSTSLETFPGGKLNALNFDISNEILQMEVGGLSKMGSTAAAAAGSGYPSAPDVLALEATNGLSVLLDSTAIDISGATASLSWPHTEDRERLGDPEIREPLISDHLAITGSLTREFDDTNQLAKFLADTNFVLEFNFKSDTVIPTTATMYEWRIKFFNCLWTASEQPVSEAGPIIETLPFVAYEDASGNIAEVVLVNGTASVS